MDFGLIAFLIVIGGSMLVGAAGGAARDVAHIAKGREGPLPSQEAAERRAKTAKTAKRVGAKAKAKRQGKQRDGYMARLFANAAEQRRIKNAGKRQADRDWIEQHRDEFSEAGYRAEQAKLERKAGRRARRERALAAFRDADKGRIKAALAARKNDQGKTDKEVSDEQDQTERESAKVLPFRQRAAEQDDTQRGDETTGDISDAVADEAAEWNADDDEPERMRLDAMPDTVLEDLARRDGDERQTAAKAILADRAARGMTVTPDEDENWHVHRNGQIERTWYRGSESTGENAGTGTPDAGTPADTPTAEAEADVDASSENTTQEVLTMSNTGEITNLTQAQAFASDATTFSNALVTNADASRAECERTISDLEDQRQRLETAQSHMSAQDMATTSAYLSQAYEHVEAMIKALDQVREGWQQAHATADAARSAFTTVEDGLGQHTGMQEQRSALGDDAARDTEFYRAQ